MKLITKMAAVAAAATLGIALLTAMPANAAEPSVSVTTDVNAHASDADPMGNGQPSSASPVPSGAIAIPMVAVPHANSSSGGVHSDVVIPGDCGTAFLYPSNGHDHVHYDFGFEYLNNATFWVNAHVGTTNEDSGRADANSFGGAYVGSSWEKQGNLYTGTGENLVTAYIQAIGPLYDCVSSPALTEDIYVY
jgi:hypothetical protein